MRLEDYCAAQLLGYSKDLGTAKAAVDVMERRYYDAVGLGSGSYFVVPCDEITLPLDPTLDFESGTIEGLPKTE